MQNGSEDLELVEAEEDVRELEQHVANQQIRIKGFQAAGRNDDEMKAREGLFLLTDALEIARRRLQAERAARGNR
jgi:5S rRNA maturation endonuclease (ribonuclease M5)